MNNKSNSRINNKNKTYKQKIQKNEALKNVKKKEINPFPITYLINSKSNLISDNNNQLNSFSLKKVLNYFLNEIFPSRIIYNISSIKGKLMITNNYSTEKNKNKMSINKSICVVIKDKNSINNCWYNGFYGKGNLSRSTPNWSERILRDIVKRNSGIKLKIPENTLDDNFSSGIKSNKSNNFLKIFKKNSDTKILNNLSRLF